MLKKRTKTLIQASVLALSMIAPVAAHADATAAVSVVTNSNFGMLMPFDTQNCWQYDSLWGSNEGLQCLAKVTITITPSGSDTGMPGAFFIGTRNLSDQTIAVYSPEGWQRFHGGLYPAAANFAALPPSVSTVVLDKQNICALAGDQPVEVWAGYGVLTRDREMAIQNYHVVKNPRIPAEHLRYVYIENDMRKNNKYWKVLDVPCAPSSNR